jgi:pimeloyl-ACP methyl ester carboxylesterase
MRRGGRPLDLEPDVTLQDLADGIVEDHGFLPIDGVQLAFARSRPWLTEGGAACDLDRGRCIGRILFIGPIGAERERAHRTMVELSRQLAQRGYEVLRYDHRGVGESTGTFEEATIGLWTDDARRVLHAFRSTNETDARTMIVGVRIGALIGGELFAEGLGDAAIFIGAGDGRSLLRDASRRALVAGLVHEGHSPTGVGTARARTGSSAVAAGAVARIDGYLWTPRLVEEAEAHRFPTPGRDEPRPWARFELSGEAAPRETGAQTRDARHRPDNRPACEDRSDSGDRCSNAGSSEGLSRTRRVRARRFWESSPRLVPEDHALIDAIASWIEGNALASAGARNGSGVDACTPR